MNLAAPPQDGPGMLLAPHSNTKIVHQNRQNVSDMRKEFSNLKVADHGLR